MKKFFLILSIACAVAISASAQSTSREEMAREGQRIAAELRASVPTEESSIRGVLEIRSKKNKVSETIPIVCSVVIKEDHWDAIYETASGTKQGAEKLIVRRYENQPNKYFYAKAPEPKAELPRLREISAKEADLPLAGSDFWLTDLGLDFLHWPQQLRTKGEMRISQWCHVLESFYPDRPNVNKIISWIDRDSADAGIAGILIAEAYDASGKEMKRFSLSGSSFKKIKGQWQLEKMEIENWKNSSKTTLRFDLKTPTLSSAGN